MIRIAMWSCPRSLSTALLRSFANRADTRVVDEPFYGAYLHENAVPHPDVPHLTEALEPDRFAAARELDSDDGTPIQYEKQISQHVTVPFVRDHLAGVRHAFLIRHPARQLGSMKKMLGTFPIEVAGWPMFEQLFDAFGGGAPVVDADDLGREPERVLTLLCQALGISFDRAMLSWEAGVHEAWGPWAKNWYESVKGSTGFAPPGPLPTVDSDLGEMYERALPVYERILPYRLR